MSDTIRFKKKFFAKVINFVNSFVPQNEDKSTHVYKFGRNNDLPNKLLELVLDSGTAKKAQSKRAAYIASDGFVDEAAADLMVNSTQTADKLLTELAGYLSYFKGYALLVKRNMKNDFVIEALPIQKVRKKSDGDFIFNPTWGTSRYERAADITISKFLGAKPLTKDQLINVRATGEIIYAYHKNADNPQYPVPDYYAGIQDIQTNSELQKLDLEAAVNGFMPSAILTTIGEFDNTTEDESGRTDQDYFEETLEQFTGKNKNADGTSNRMRLMIMNAKTKDEIPSLQTFDAKAIIDGSINKRNENDRSVCRLFGVHPVLCGFSDAAILGNTQAIANASNELNNDVIPDQQLVTEIFEMLYPEFDFTISTFRPIQFVPDAILADLTSDERRALAGYPALNKPVAP